MKLYGIRTKCASDLFLAFFFLLIWQEVLQFQLFSLFSSKYFKSKIQNCPQNKSASLRLALSTHVFLCICSLVFSVFIGNVWYLMHADRHAVCLLLYELLARNTNMMLKHACVMPWAIEREKCKPLCRICNHTARSCSHGTHAAGCPVIAMGLLWSELQLHARLWDSSI